MNIKRGHAKILALKELKDERKEKITKSFLLMICLISFFLLVFFVSMHLFEITGLVNYLTGQGGYITEVTIESSWDVGVWSGFYGLVLTVSDFTQLLSEDLEAGTIERMDIFFDCVQTDAQGGPEVYASTNSSLSLTVSNIQPATVGMIDSYINCTNAAYCANNTFTKNMTIYFGSTNITGIPSTHTYKYNGQNEIFDIGALNVSGNLVFVAHVNATIQKGYNENVLVNYQMLLPVPDNTTSTYYFYTDPNDECPGGGIGNTINATIYGYISNSSGKVPNATVTVAGYSALSNATGFYNLSTLVLEGTYTYLVQKDGYDPYISNVTVNSSYYVIEKNATLTAQTNSSGNTVTPLVYGTVKTTGGSALADVNVSLGNATTTSNSTGDYSFYPTVTIGTQPIIAIKANYDAYYYYLTFYSNTTVVNHNITMEAANLYDFPTGPFTEDSDSGEGKNNNEFEQIKKLAEQLGQDYWISTSEIDKQVRENTFVEEKISIYNFKETGMTLVFDISDELDEIMGIDKTAMTIGTESYDSVIITIYGTQPLGIYRGTVSITGDLESTIPAKIEIVPRTLNVHGLEMSVELFKDSVEVAGTLKYRVNINNLLSEQNYKVALKYLITDPNGVIVHLEETEEIELTKSVSLLKEFSLPEDLPEGEYLLNVEATYLDNFSHVVAPFKVSQPIYLYAFFGIPLWLILAVVSFLSFILFNFYLYKAHVRKKKRYHLSLNMDLLPKPGEKSIKLGKIAETNVPAYYNVDDLTTHAIVAGATGGGKSISAQVVVEGALERGIAVIVFDPTAQWSGMLRKCDDKKMLSFYPKFGLKPSDAKAFPGNVRQIHNEREFVDVRKFMNPGQIQIFTMSKLAPQQIDTFVAGVISGIFKTGPDEHPGLRLMLVFDEVHRLLPKFGGSGKGFLQIERACREFRKWGFGVMLVSQVLSDFVGEIKANINTEIQVRVAEENDLERVRERYGLDALKSLVRADVGTGMIQNAEYNKGLPYFVSFRPIFHNTRRLPDDILEKYNNYNEVIDDLDYQIEQLEQEKIDTFDLKMELKLVKDKLMTGNFTVVDIYLEGLKPRIEKQWDSIGKKPKKREIELIKTEDIEASIKEAQKGRQEFEKTQEKETQKAEEKKEDISKKIVAPFTFENGMMISSLKELKESIPSIDNEIFAEHVNENKNEIADWVKKEINPELGEKLKAAKKKEEFIKIVSDFEKAASKTDEKQKEDKKENKDKESGKQASNDKK